MIAKDTLIKTPDGYVPIQNLERGDLVEVLKDRYTGHREIAHVTENNSKELASVIHLIFKGANQDQLTVSINTNLIDQYGEIHNVCEIEEGTMLYSEDKKSRLEFISYTPNIKNLTRLFTLKINQSYDALICTERGIALSIYKG